MSALVLGSDSESVRRPFTVECRRSPLPTTNSRKIAARTQNKKEPQRPSFSKRLYAATSKKDAKLPIVIAATKNEVDDFLANNEEHLHLTWRFWNGKFIVEELNTE